MKPVFYLILFLSLFLLDRSAIFEITEVMGADYQYMHLQDAPEIEGIGAPTARNCAKCHRAHYEEWSHSTHAKAFTDLQFQAELRKLENPRWLCLNCHIPLKPQREFHVQGLFSSVIAPYSIKNPEFDREFQKEGITCAVCHVRKDSQGNGYILGNLRSEKSPHPVKVAPADLRGQCARCHQPEGEYITPNLYCWFDTYEEMDESIKNGKLKDDTTCSDCHQKEVQREIVNGFGLRSSHHHFFFGGGIPKDYQTYKIQEEHFKPGLEAKVEKTRDKIFLSLKSHNGHYLPTGDPERHLRIRIQFDGKENTIKELRIGQTWQWNPAVKLADNRMKPGETRVLEIQIPKLARKALIQIHHVRLSDENLESMRYSADHTLVTKEVKARLRHMKKLYPQESLVFRQRLDF